MRIPQLEGKWSRKGPRKIWESNGPVTITPEMARAFLATNPKNRTIREGHVEMLMREMTNGRWEYNGKPLIFDANGKMIEGHHRCLSSDRANVSFEARIMRTNKDILHLIDTNAAPRSDIDIVRISGEHRHFINPERAVRIANALMRYSGTGRKASALEKAAFRKKHCDVINATCEDFPGKTHIDKVTVAWVLGPYTKALYHEERARLQELPGILMTGKHNSSDAGHLTAVNLLHHVLLNSNHIGDRQPYRKTLYRKVLRGIQGFCTSEQLDKIMACREDPYPLPT